MQNSSVMHWLHSVLNSKKCVKVSYNDIMIKAVARALRDVPAVNASWSDDAITRHGRVNAGMAVAPPDGLITPVTMMQTRWDLQTLLNKHVHWQPRPETNNLSQKNMRVQHSPFRLGHDANRTFHSHHQSTQLCNSPVGSLQQEPVAEMAN